MDKVVRVARRDGSETYTVNVCRAQSCNPNAIKAITCNYHWTKSNPCGSEYLTNVCWFEIPVISWYMLIVCWRVIPYFGSMSLFAKFKIIMTLSSLKNFVDILPYTSRLQYRLKKWIGAVIDTAEQSNTNKHNVSFKITNGKITKRHLENTQTI